eukprot:TRINITY_DN14838_c0_g1_i1.p1 TRINITY_DN14838_c0_g1~~TRINITY_DN14838_c0_g1_i1.p1  ORF type:complete len:327 (-),score=70.75 TRINITY_DN14838_c0_g1_i1:32-1012(-)
MASVNLMAELRGKVAVVAGATRGAGRAIAVALGKADVIVYCTGRSTRDHPSDMNRKETIEETAEIINEANAQRSGGSGRGIPVRVDHLDESQVKSLFERVKQEQGRLDILVNDVWGGDPLAEWGKPFWELDMQKGKVMLDRAIMTHVITSKYGVPLMLESPIEQGLLIEVTDGTGIEYRGNLFYDLAKHSVNRLAFVKSEELTKHHQDNKRSPPIACVALTPGFLRSEAMLDHFGVTEETWRDAIAKEPYFEASETPHYIGQAVVALARDSNMMKKNGQVLSTWGLSEEYPSVVDKDGSKPHWEKFYKKKKQEIEEKKAGEAHFFQ